MSRPRIKLQNLEAKTRSRPHVGVQTAIKNKDVDTLLWSLIDWAFEAIQDDPRNKDFHILLRDMSVLVANRPTTSQVDVEKEAVRQWFTE